MPGKIKVINRVLMPARAIVSVISFLILFFSIGFDSFAREIRGKPIVPRTATKAPAKSTIANPTAEASSVPLKPAKNPDYLEASFDKLAGYTFAVPDGLQPTNSVANPAKADDQIPADVKAFDQKKVSLTGFMLPLKVDDGVVTEMLIMKDQSMCCYGAVPRINDWVSVKMKKGGVKSVMDQPVTLYGKLKVGEILENGYLVGIYEMDGEKMDEPKE